VHGDWFDFPAAWNFRGCLISNTPGIQASQRIITTDIATDLATDIEKKSNAKRIALFLVLYARVSEQLVYMV